MAALLAFSASHTAVALLTWWRSRRSDGSDFFLGRRTLSAPVVAMSLLLTNLSTEQLVGLNGDGYRHGAVVIAWEIFGAFGLVLFAVVFLPRYWAAGVTTIPEFIEQRCGAPTRRLMTVLMLLSLVGIGLPFVLYSERSPWWGSSTCQVALESPTMLRYSDAASCWASSAAATLSWAA